jgi:hypothetical protein
MARQSLDSHSTTVRKTLGALHGSIQQTKTGQVAGCCILSKKGGQNMLAVFMVRFDNFRLLKAGHPMPRGSYIALFSITFAVIAAAAMMIPVGIDWEGGYYPAGRDILRGHSPYHPLSPEKTGFLNPPWVLVVIAPLTLLGLNLSWGFWFAANFILYVLALYRWRARLAFIGVAMLMPFAFMTLWNGNLDAVVLFGSTLAPFPAGLFIVLLKPQMGIGLAAYWGIELWRREGMRQAVFTFIPVTLAFGVSLLIFGNFFEHGNSLVHIGWNVSIFPYGIPVGLLLLGVSLYTHQPAFAFLSGAFFAPYVHIYSLYAAVLPSLSLVFKRKSTVSAIETQQP